MNLSTIVDSRRNLAIGVKVGISARVGESLDFVTLGIVNQLEVGVAIPSRGVEVQTQRSEPSSEPILKVEFFILR